jgi:hypothetical protein
MSGMVLRANQFSDDSGQGEGFYKILTIKIWKYKV